MSKLVRGMVSVSKWSGIVVVAAFVVVVIAGNGYRFYARHELEKIPPPGRLVDIGTHRMHILCEGSGRPTVILDAGGGGNVVSWDLVLEQAKAITRVCAFDRSGQGWSEPSPMPTGRETRAADLEALLAASGEPGPYVFAGHSLGGEQAWLYTQDHLDQAAGLITVDSVPPNAIEVGMPAASGDPDLFTRALTGSGLEPALMSLVLEFALSTSEIPDDMKQALKQAMLRPLVLGSEDEGTELFIASADEMHDLGDLPLVVITHGQPGILISAFGSRAAEAEESWQAGQARLSKLSSLGKLIVAEHSDHRIPFSAPEVVVAAIDELVAGYRAESL